MSKQSTRKAARRDKRIAQKVVWARLTEVLDEDLELEDDEVEVVVTQVEHFDHRITQRGWTFDEHNSVNGVVSWYFAPSGFEPADDDVEPVTRVWLTSADLDVVNVILAGADGARSLSVDQLLDQLDTIEAHRVSARE